MNNDASLSTAGEIRFDPVTRVGNQLRFSFNAQPGQTYTLESTAALGTSWNTEQTITTDTATATFTVVPSTNAKFFRIRR